MKSGNAFVNVANGVGLRLKAMAQATSVDDVFGRLEADGFFLRMDATVTPTMSRGAMVSEAELALPRQIGDVVRRGHVRRIQRDRIVFDGGSVPTGPGTPHVHCAAVGLASLLSGIAGGTTQFPLLAA